MEFGPVTFLPSDSAAVLPSLLLVGALILGGWAAAALYMVARAKRTGGRSGGGREALLSGLLSASPAMRCIIRRDGAITMDDRLVHSLGLAETPTRLSDLTRRGGPFEDAAADALQNKVEESFASACALSLDVALRGSRRVLQATGERAPAALLPDALLIWFTEGTEAQDQVLLLRIELQNRTAALEALTGLIEAAPFPIWHRGPELKLAMVNRAYVRAVEGADAARVVRDGIELIDEADGRSPQAFAAEVRDRQAPAQRVLPATVAGERRMVEVVEVPLGPSGVAGFAIDIEDREQARGDLARFVRAQRDMLDRLSAGVAQFGRDRSLIFFNQPFARLFGLSADLLADRPEFERVIDAMREAGSLPEVRDFPQWRAERRGWFTSGLAADEEDWLLPGGKHLRVVAQPLPDGGLLLIFEDRTEQIQLASARDTLLRVRTATFDNLFEAVGVFASDGRLHLWNNRFRDLWQFDEEQLARHPRIDALTPHIGRLLKKSSHANLVRELVRSATVERKQRSGRVSLIDGREFEFAAVPLPDGNALFTMLDVTDSRKVETALRDRNEALEAADRLKTAFVSNMSYELRTPLTSIGGFAEMLAGGYAGSLSETGSEYVQAILDSVTRLSVLIDNVLDLTQSDSGSLLLAEDEVDLTALCRAVAEEAEQVATRKQIRLAVDLKRTVGGITGDRRRLGQAIGNLLRNSLSYTDPGGRVLLHAEGDAREARIVVSDNGRGIAPADQARVFDRFHRTVAAAGDDGPAVGLGLALARQFVEAHGGTIDLQSEVGEGTTISVRLPRKPRARPGRAG